MRLPGVARTWRILRRAGVEYPRNEGLGSQGKARPLGGNGPDWVSPKVSPEFRSRPAGRSLDSWS